MALSEKTGAELVSDFFNSNKYKNPDFIEILETVIREYKTKDRINNVPLSVFSNRKLGILEAVVKYLKENGLTYHEIAVMLDRDDRTIWATYNKAIKKDKNVSEYTNSETINPTIFSNRAQAPLEALIKHLKEKGMKFKQISLMLNRSYKTIWLTYNKKK